MDLQKIYDKVIAGDAPGVKQVVEHAVAEGVSPSEIISQYLIPAMAEVGALFERQEFYVPEMLVAARAMQTGLGVLKPLLVEGELETAGRVVMGTVKGDLHNIGKNLVSMMLEGAGFGVTDLGVDVSPERFVVAVREQRPDVVGMSALLTTTMPAMASTIGALVEAGLRDTVKIMYAPDAASAVRQAKQLLGIH